MYKFRRATSNDIPDLISLLRELTELEEDFDFSPEKHQSGLELLLAAPEDKACILVAEDTCENRVVGMCSAQVAISTAMGGYSVWVEDVVIASSCRGKGIGKSMLEKLKEWAETTAKASRLQLWADRDNLPAIEFYTATGWNITNGIVLKTII